MTHAPGPYTAFVDVAGPDGLGKAEQESSHGGQSMHSPLLSGAGGSSWGSTAGSGATTSLACLSPGAPSSHGGRKAWEH